MDDHIYTSFDAVVIGAGHAGLGAAAALVEQGLKPLVIEKHNLPGGLATSFVRGRFEFEPAMHVLPMYYGTEQNPGSAYKAVWEDTMHINEPFIEIPHTFSVAYDEPDGTSHTFHFPVAIKELIPAVEKELPGSASHLKQYFDIIMSFGAVMKEFGIMAAGGPDVDLLEKYPLFFEYQGLTVDEAYEKMSMPIPLRNILDIYWFYFGMPNKKMPFLYAGLCYLQMGTTGYIPKNRSHGITAGMETAIIKKGGTFWYNTTATNILVENGKVIGVETDKGDKIICSTVFANASPDSVYRKLISPKSEVPEAAVKKCNYLKLGPSYFVVYIALDASKEELGIHDYHNFLQEHYDNNVCFDESEKLQTPMSQGTLCYNVADPDFSPTGTCVVSISCVMQSKAFYDVKPDEYQKAKERLADGLIINLEKRLGVSIRDHIEEIEIATPVTFARYTDQPDGTILSYEYTDVPLLRSAASSYEDNTSAIDGLTLIGAYTAAGIGYLNGQKGFETATAVAMAMKEVKA